MVTLDAAGRPAPRLAPRAALALLLLVTGALVLAGYLLKAQCKDDYNRDRDRLLCSNDIQYLYDVRGLSERQFPYVEGGLVDGQLTGAVLEYPVLTGIAAWVPSLWVESSPAYLSATALTLAPFAFLVTLLLWRLARWRALLWAAGPPLALYSFHNWDLLVVAATVVAIWLWRRGSTTGAAVALAVGGSLKLWPAFFVAPLLLLSLRDGDRRQALRTALAAAGTFLAINLPFIVINHDGWWAPYAFQELRGADITSNSIWFWGLPDLTTDQLNGMIPLLLAGAFLMALMAGWWRSQDRDEPYPWVQVSAAMLCAFMLLNKAHSPQFALWLLPFFVLVRLQWGWWTSYLAFDLLLFTGLFRWYFDLSRGLDFGLAKQALVLGVWGRAVLLVLLFVVFLRSDLNGGPEDVPRDDGGQPTQRDDSHTVATATIAGSASPR